MASTKLKRKARRNKTVAKVRVDNIKRLGIKPVIKRVDVESIKEEFAGSKKSAPKAKKETVEAAADVVVEETKVEEKVEKEAPAKKPTAKKPAAKKAAAKKSAAKDDSKEESAE